MTFYSLGLMLIIAILAVSSIVANSTQRRHVTIYKQAYEQAIRRAEENGKQVDRALEAANKWKEAFGRMESAYKTMREANAKNERNIAAYQLEETIRREGQR